MLYHYLNNFIQNILNRRRIIYVIRRKNRSS
nr:MAG TPA: hypothetical protein [Caudoviricetes sp.]